MQFTCTLHASATVVNWLLRHFVLFSRQSLGVLSLLFVIVLALCSLQAACTRVLSTFTVHVRVVHVHVLIL